MRSVDQDNWHRMLYITVNSQDGQYQSNHIYTPTFKLRGCYKNKLYGN